MSRSNWSGNTFDDVLLNYENCDRWGSKERKMKGKTKTKTQLLIAAPEERAARFVTQHVYSIRRLHANTLATLDPVRHNVLNY